MRITGAKSEAEQCKGYFSTRREHSKIPSLLLTSLSHCYSEIVLSYIVLNYASIKIPNLYLCYEDT